MSIDDTASDRLLTEVERQHKYLARLPDDYQFPLFNAAQALESQRRHEYRVQYHRPNQKKWINAGTFRDRVAANKEVQKLEHKGYKAQIVTL